MVITFGGSTRATGMPSMENEYYRQVVELIRAKNTSLILNNTTGPGGRFAQSQDDPACSHDQGIGTKEWVALGDGGDGRGDDGRLEGAFHGRRHRTGDVTEQSRLEIDLSGDA